VSWKKALRNCGMVVIFVAPKSRVVTKVWLLRVLEELAGRNSKSEDSFENSDDNRKWTIV
jgi:hypothetical protein